MSPEDQERLQRGLVHLAIEEATGQPLSVDDTLADSLIAAAGAIGIETRQLITWIYDMPKFAERGDWTGEALASWARARGFIAEEKGGEPPEEKRA